MPGVTARAGRADALAYQIEQPSAAWYRIHKYGKPGQGAVGTVRLSAPRHYSAGCRTPSTCVRTRDLNALSSSMT
jgi:hypothetical protein